MKNVIIYIKYIIDSCLYISYSLVIYIYLLYKEKTDYMKIIFIKKTYIDRSSMDNTNKCTDKSLRRGEISNIKHSIRP